MLLDLEIFLLADFELFLSLLVFLVFFPDGSRGALFIVAFLLVAQDCLLEIIGDLLLGVASMSMRFLKLPVLFFFTVIFVI